MAVFVLLHSPSVGPATWSPVADRLRFLGSDVVVPSLLTVGHGGPPFWPRIVRAVNDALADTDPGQPVVLVGHSNAGVFIPVIADGTGRDVSCLVFADATVPAASGRTPMAPPEFLPFLRGMAGPDGRLPRWTDWWPEDEVARMFPGDPRLRDVIREEQPRLPLAYYLEQVPAPAGWQRHRCGYLLFSEAYQDEAAQARRRGWPVRSVPGDHLHQIVAPDEVASAVLSLTGGAAGT